MAIRTKRDSLPSDGTCCCEMSPVVEERARRAGVKGRVFEELQRRFRRLRPLPWALRTAVSLGGFP